LSILQGRRHMFYMSKDEIYICKGGNHLLGNILAAINLFFAIIIGLYFMNLLKGQQGNKVAVERESKKELEKLQRLREISLSEPLSEKTRPKDFKEIVGQEEGIKALKAALCGPNPQHVLIYGPPGVGKTCAARIVLEEAKRNTMSPFRRDAKFVEMDATSVRFDERSIADPLIGSVHDPIYQGAGPLGVAGIPQPKPGAVTKAHGGVLFLDEIGELHPIQMNKLLKVLEDRKVFLESAYYNSEDGNIPRHIHEIFKRGLPADFRLVGATTRNPDEISPAIRSRCLEIYFRGLTQEENKTIARGGAEKAGFDIEEKAIEIIGKYASNGRDTVNIVQLAGGLALTENRNHISSKDIEWVINSGHYSPRPEKRIFDKPQIGFVNGLAVYGANLGTLIEVEASALPSIKGGGIITVTGIIDEEEFGNGAKRSRRKSTAKGSVDNVMTVIRKYLKVEPKDFDIHLNFPGGIPIDGPSAGISMVVAIYSAITGLAVDNNVAMTGEISIRGEVKPVGGINAKLQAAIQAGVKKVIIPEDNWNEQYLNYPISVISVSCIEKVVTEAVCENHGREKPESIAQNASLLSATARRHYTT
ncbi:MAG TPA: ATP-dependent protease LonB, partial [Anaerovoracaceae bacterium]|nr:ATP-dependent protease LonB [Anaerovoracaceae bacterium]